MSKAQRVSILRGSTSEEKEQSETRSRHTLGRETAPAHSPVLPPTGPTGHCPPTLHGEMTAARLTPESQPHQQFHDHVISQEAWPSDTVLRESSCSASFESIDTRSLAPRACRRDLPPQSRRGGGASTAHGAGRGRGGHGTPPLSFWTTARRGGRPERTLTGCPGTGKAEARKPPGKDTIRHSA